MKRASYNKHEYSGPKKRKKSAVAFARHYGEGTSRSSEWRNTSKAVPGEGSPAPQILIKDYSRKPLQETQNLVPQGSPLSPQQQSKLSPTQQIDFTWPSDVENVEEHQLFVEAEPAGSSPSWDLVGYRVVDIQHLIKSCIDMQKKHSRVCTCSNINFIKEKRNGLRSELIFKCSTCDTEFRQWSEEHEKVNKAFVWGALTSGSHYAQAHHILSTMDIPTITAKKFREIELELGTIWEDHLYEEMKEAGKREKEIAIEKGHIGKDGVPEIMVYVDGGWSKRSYGHNFSASSGIACIIGAETKKCLFLGVRNKYCSVCAFDEKNDKKRQHVCFRNYSGSSTGMETDILVEGFSKSIEMHGLRFTSFVGDGDSSVFARLTQKVPYGNIITKKECKNHVIKNYTGALYKIANDTKMPREARKILTPKIQKLTAVARMQMKQSNAQKMRKDLKNGPLHVFGDHEKCDKYYCRYVAEENQESEKDQNLVPSLKKHILVWASIETAVENICRKADRLIGNVTNNVAENFMSLMAKFNCGKRLNLTQRGSYNRRAHIAGLCQISGLKWHHKAWTKASNHKPGRFFANYLKKQEKVAKHRAVITRKKNYTPKPKTTGQKADKDYGPQASDVPILIPDEELKELCEKKLQEFQVDDLDKINEIQQNTIGQHGNALYDELRKDRLTASQFGMICKRRKNTSCNNHVKAVLYKTNFSNSDTTYGQNCEKVAIKKFELEMNKTVIPSGLFIDPQYGFLGASPDGIVIGESAIVEVKTFPSLARAGQSLEEAAQVKKNFCLRLDSDGELKLKTNHNFYYQIQGQIHVARKEKCYLILFISNEKPIKVIIIERDFEFIEGMVMKLHDFYVQCILPEIILRRIPQNSKCREPVKQT